MSKKVIIGLLVFAFIWLFAPDLIPGMIDNIAVSASVALVACIGAAINKAMSSKQIGDNE